MKKIRYFIVAIWAILMLPCSLNAQQTVAASKGSSNSDGWKTVMISESGMNVMNGVSFFHKRGICKSETVILIKAVNSNTFPVQIQWQENTGVTKVVTIPASSEAEGKCNSDKADSPESKLVIPKANMKHGQERISRNNLLSTLKVTEVK